MAKHTCSVTNCERPHAARGWCQSHYGQWRHRGVVEAVAQNASMVLSMRECASCGDPFRPSRTGNIYCSPRCCDRRGVVPCAICDGPVWAGPDQRCRTCRESADGSTRTGAFLAARRANPKDAWSILESGLKERVRLEDDCWIWTGSLDRHGYPRISVTGGQIMIHRLTLEASLGRRLGLDEHAHHRCANRSCVNPEHLQAVAHQQNLAEMLARNAYVRRIKELEAALTVLAPDHPALSS